ncbi:MAG: restriction endonuclease subunit S [Cyanobacteriota bacterium]
MSELIQIEEIAQVKQGRYTSPNEFSEIATDHAKVPVWGANGILGYTQKATYEEAHPLVTCRGNGCGLIQWSGGRAHISNNAMAIVLHDRDQYSSKYLYYSLLNADFADVTTGSAQPQITMGHLNKKEIYWHSDQNEREAIVHILGTLDDKIELNRKTNETLEAMAKALFKSWFVDFDPVRAKEEGRPTGLPADINDLFPDSFEDSELGEIPSGWNVAELGDCSLDIESGRRPKGGIDKNLAFGIPSIGAESIAPVGQFNFSKTKWVEAAFADSAAKGWIRNHDVALYKDGGKPGEFRPRTAFYGDGFPFEKAMVNEHVFLLRSSQLGQPYLYYLFGFDLVLVQIIHKGSSKGAQPGLNQDEVRTSSFIKPSKRLLDAFNFTVESSIRKQLMLGKESQVLSRLRDFLLPKLISGDLRIPDAEKMLVQVLS